MKLLLLLAATTTADLTGINRWRNKAHSHVDYRTQAHNDNAFQESYMIQILELMKRKQSHLVGGNSNNNNSKASARRMRFLSSYHLN